MRINSLSFGLSLFLHVAVVEGAGRTFLTPAEYDVELGSGGIEINLIAAPNAATQASEVTFLEPDALHQHDVEEKKIPEQSRDAVELSSEKSDGSSPVPGKDETTLSSIGGAISEAKAGYLKNPAPPYPKEAREKGWQGIVVLRVIVSKTGLPDQIEIEHGSGYALLDQAALQTVQKWKFRPAQIGDLPIETVVRIPIRFELENEKK